MPRKTRKEIVTSHYQAPKARVEVMPSMTHGKGGKARRRNERRAAKQAHYYQED